jgi:hypothetical protein
MRLLLYPDQLDRAINRGAAILTAGCALILLQPVLDGVGVLTAAVATYCGVQRLCLLDWQGRRRAGLLAGGFLAVTAVACLPLLWQLGQGHLPGVTGGMGGGLDTAAALILLTHQARFLLSAIWYTLGPGFRAIHEPSGTWPRSSERQHISSLIAQSTGITPVPDHTKGSGDAADRVASVRRVGT